MSFTKWSNEKKKERYEVRTEDQSNNTSSSRVEKTSFSDWSYNRRVSSIDQDYINTFLSDAKNFISTAENDYKTVGWGNASSIYDTKYSAWNDLGVRAAFINEWLERNSSTIDKNTYSNLKGFIDAYQSSASSVVNSFENAKKYYGQWRTEDAYNAYKSTQDILNSDDFEYYAYRGANVANPSWKDSYAPVSIGGWTPFGDGKDIANMVTFAEANEMEAYKASLAAMENHQTDEKANLAVLINQYMTDEEKSVYNYYIGIGKADKANEYLNSLVDTFRMKQAGVIAEKVDGNALELILSSAAGLDSFMSGIKNLDNFITGKEADPTSTLQYANSMVRENNEGIWGIANDFTYTVSNMLPSVLMSYIPVVGQAAGIASLGASATGNAYSEMINLGYDKNQARGYALLVGASESTLQYLLGGISKLGGKVSGNAIGNFVSKFDNAIARTAITLGGNMLSEGLEEAIQTAIEPMFKALVTGEEFESAEWDEILYSALLGSLTAGIMDGVPLTRYITNANRVGNLYTDSKADLVNEALEIDPDNAHASRMKARLDSGKDVSAYQLNRLVEANEQALVKQDTAKMTSAAVERLTQLGETGDVSKLADVIVKQASGEHLSLSEKAILKNSKYGQRVANELNPQNIESGMYSSAWAENIGTERINEGAYNKGLYDLATEQAGLPVATEATPVTKNTPEKEIATESEFKASTDGKTKIGDTEVSIKEIASVKDGEITLRLEDGSTVNARDVEFSSSEEGLLYENVVHMGLNAATANAFIKGYNPSMSVQEYALGFREAYRYGEYGFPVQEMTADGFSAKLSESQKSLAYNLGKTDAKYKVDLKQAKIASISAKNVGKDSQKASKKGKLHNTIKPTTERQKASLKALGVVAETLGVDIYTFESPVVNGKRQGANGWFDPKDGSIHIDIHAGINGEGTMLFTAAHELTHFIREWSPAKFKVFADFLLEQYGKKGVSVDALVREQIEKAKRNGRDITYDTAYEEVIADSCEMMLADGDAIAKIAELKAKDKTLWQKVKDFLTKLVARIKSAYEGMTPDSVEGRYVSEMLDTAEKLKALWTEALVEASDNYTSAEKTLLDNGIAVNSNTESASLMSVRDLLNSEQQQKVAKTLAERFGVTVEEAKNWISAETSLASLILNPKYSQYLDYVADPNEEAVKSNSDYPQGTVDFSNICKKRRDFTEVMNRVLRNFPNHVFEATDLAKIRTIMSEEGMEVACGICYVEDRRQLDSIVAQDFIDSLALYRKGSKTRPDGKAFNANQLKALKLIDGDSYVPSIYELISLEGRNSLKAKNPTMEEAWVKFNNARGMQSVRLLLNDAEYKRQILNYKPSVVKRKNDLGGLRIYSFSDMEMFHLIDIIQVITDSATVGLSLQGYTKVNEYAKAVKDTGEKLNRSLIPKGDLGYHIENGRIVLDYDTVEGIDVNHPDFFDNIDNPNVGNIVIGINATQIKAAMTSKFIDQIIPFHTGQSNEVLGEKGIATWVNYKDFQSERDLSTGKKSSHQINIYTEVIQAAEAEGKPITNKVDFVNKFLEVCKENDLEPRFSEFLNVDGNGNYIYTEGYHKFLVDFKTFDPNTGEYLPQMPVKPIFDNSYITKLLKDYVKTQKKKDADFSKAIPKVLERITNEIVNPSVKYSDREASEISNADYWKMFDHFGATKNYDVAGYMLQNGVMLDFSGKHWGDVNSTFRQVDHRDIQEVLGNRGSNNGVNAMIDMIGNGNIRLMPEVGGINLAVEPNATQMSQLRGYINHFKGEVTVDIDKVGGDTIHSWNYTRGTSSAKILADIKAYFDEGIVPKQKAEGETDIRQFLYSDRASYAPTFYSYMGKVVDGIKSEKVGANGVVSYLKGKGVKAEEIKWSGIEAFLEGKKSVTKAELQEFVAGSQLEIVEQMSNAATFVDEDGNTYTDNEFKEKAYAMADEQGIDRDRVKFVLDPDDGSFVAYAGSRFNGIILEAEADESGTMTRWSEYKLDGGSNYRELVFQLPNSSYSNRAMRGHWGQDAEGVLAHARIQDFNVNGKKMLFIEEIQSDWHNEGHQKGYSTKEYEDAVESHDKLYNEYKKLDLAFHKYVRSNEFMTDPEDVRKKKHEWLRGKAETAQKKYLEAEKVVESLKEKGAGDTPNAPFRATYHEYVLKRLLRMAAEEGYDSIGWTPADIQSERWSEDYAEGYRIEYDQDIPSFLKKYGKKWGAKVGKTVLSQGLAKANESYIASQKEYIAGWQESLAKAESDSEADFIREQIKYHEQEIKNAEVDGETVWSMSIPDSMKDSVLHEGQVLYSDRVTDKKTLDFLNKQIERGEYITTYKSMRLDDGKLHSPMAAEINGKFENEYELGQWYQAVEHPELIKFDKKNGLPYFELDKGVDEFGDELGKVPARYNPYEHSSNYVINDQFKTAFKRRNLVVVEMRIPLSETTSGYQAQYAKDPVGWQEWKKGDVASALAKKGKERKVFLSRWAMPYRILSDAEVAQQYKELLSGTGVTVPNNVVTPSLLTALENEGVAIDYNGIKKFEETYAKKAKAREAKKALKYSDRNTASFNGKPFWSGSVSLLDGVIEEVHTMEEAEAVDYHHSLYFSQAQVEKMESGENAFFWVDNGIVQGNWRESVPKSIIDRIKEQITVKYSDRDTDSFSNRSLLANALESVAQNDIERKKLEEYKSKISLIESEQAKLAEVRAKIKELSFAKGKRDSEAINKLQFEANQTANRINTYDKQLLNLESTKALKDVLQREKQMAYKRAEQRGKEALSAYRERAAKTQRELMNRYQESRKKGIENRHKTAMRHKIKDVVGELNKYLLKGTKDKHVPIELQKAVAEALDAVNMDTVGAEERLAKIHEQLQKDPFNHALLESYKRISEQGERMDGKLQALKNAYDEIVNSNDPLIANSHDEVISNSIASVIKEVGDTPLRDMSLAQLESVYDMYKMVLTTIRNTNKAFKAAKSEEISVIANRVMEEIDKLGKKKLYRTKASQHLSTFDWNNLKPVYAFERIGSNTFTEVFNNVRAGEDTWAVDITEAKDFSEEQKKKHQYDSWDFKKRYNFTSSSGMNFELSLDQIMSLYAYSKREQAKDHLKKGGIVFDETTEITVKNKLGIPIKFNPTQATAYNLSDETLADIIGKLTEEQKAFVDAMQDYLSTTMGEKGNEVSLALYGVKLYKEKNYFPLKSATQFMAKAKEQQKGEVKIKNSGFSKETVAKASNPIVLTPFMDVWASHVNDMSMYHAFVLPLEDFYRVYNYKTPTSDTMATESVEMFLQNAFGKGATQYIDQLLKDLNGGARSDPRESVGKAVMSNFKKAAVMGSMSVVIQQPSAIVRATALVDAKHFVGKKPTRGKHKEVWAEVKKYAPVAVIKEMGYFDTGMGKGSVEWIKGEKTVMDKVDDLASKLPALADELTWCAIWNAVKRETLHTHKDLKPNSEEFLKVVGERFTEVITKTQVYDSTLSRSANMRSKSAFMNMLTSFMAEPTTSINMLQDAVTKFKGGNKKQLARVFGAVYGSVVLNSALVSIVYAMRDDDEDETFLEKYLSRFTTEIIDGANPLTYIPFVKDIWSAAQGFDIERADMSLITEMFDSLQNLVKVASRDTSDMSEDELAEHKKAVSDALMGIADNLGSLVGLPVKNVRRDINGIINAFNTIKEDLNGRETTAGSLADNVLEDVKNSLPILGWLPDESKGDKLYDAIIKGDTAYVDRLKSGYKSESAYNSAIRTALRENDPRVKEAAVARYNGDISEYMRIAKSIIAEGNFSQDNIVAAINSEINTLKKGEGTSESSASSNKVKSLYEVSDYYAALVGRDQASAYVVKEDIIKADVANGKTNDEAEANFNSRFASHIRDQYEEGNISAYDAENMLVNYGGKSEEDASSKVQYWEFSKRYPDYDLTESAVKNYYSEVEPSGISVNVYYDYIQGRASCKGVDLDGDGRADSGSVKSEVMRVINSLPITSYQKDVLYYLNGWSAKTICEAPWH